MRRGLGCGGFVGHGLVGPRRASTPQRLAFLPVLAQLPGFFFQHLPALAQGLAEQVDDLHPRRPLDGHGQRPGSGVQGKGHEAFQFEGVQLVLLGPGPLAGPANLPELFTMPHGRPLKGWSSGWWGAGAQSRRPCSATSG